VKASVDVSEMCFPTNLFATDRAYNNVRARTITLELAHCILL